jgi:putative ABC transport system permease protein
MNLLFAAIQQSLFFLPLTFGVYLSYRVLAVTDLTVDGTFVLGASVFAKLLTSGCNQYLSAMIAILAGAAIGMLVAIMQKIIKINSLLAGILATFMLYSVNFRVMGRPNISLLESNSILGNLQTASSMSLFVTMSVFSLVLILLLAVFLYSKVGLLLRAYGNNLRLLRALGKSTLLMLILGLSISNGLAALCGVINAQIDGYADLNMGIGMALTAIGAVVIGRHLINRLLYRSPKFNVLVDCCSCISGTFLYFLAMNLFLFFNINPIYLKLVLGLVLVIFLGMARYAHAGEMSYATEQQ